MPATMTTCSIAADQGESVQVSDTTGADESINSR